VLSAVSCHRKLMKILSPRRPAPDGRGEAGGKGFVDQSPHDRCWPLSARVSSRCSVRWCRGRSPSASADPAAGCRLVARSDLVLWSVIALVPAATPPPLPDSGGPCDARPCSCLCRGRALAGILDCGGFSSVSSVLKEPGPAAVRAINLANLGRGEPGQSQPRWREAGGCGSSDLPSLSLRAGRFPSPPGLCPGPSPLPCRSRDRGRDREPPGLFLAADGERRC
jgi:hypothetical protein